jgi:hypothetical protein
LVSLCDYTKYNECSEMLREEIVFIDRKDWRKQKERTKMD